MGQVQTPQVIFTTKVVWPLPGLTLSPLQAFIYGAELQSGASSSSSRLEALMSSKEDGVRLILLLPVLVALEVMLLELLRSNWVASHICSYLAGCLVITMAVPLLHCL